MATLTVNEVLNAIQEGLVAGEGHGDDLEREAWADYAVSEFFTVKAREAMEQGEEPLSPDREAELRRQALDVCFGGGKFQVPLTGDVTDVYVNRPDVIWLKQADGTRRRGPSDLFGDEGDLRREVALLARRAGGTERRFDDANPKLVLRLPDGSRMAAVMKVSSCPQVTIRRNLLGPVPLPDLEQRGMIDLALHRFFKAAVLAGQRIVFSGETGIGKTTLVRACLQELPVDTRIIIIEDTKELDLSSDPERKDHVLEWETREANVESAGEITQRELLKLALRFDPDWLTLGEARDGDAAREMLLAMQHGHPSMSTVHHHNASGAWRKLAQYVSQGQERFDFGVAAGLIADAVDFFVHLGRDTQGNRVVNEVCEVAGFNGTEVQLNSIFKPGDDRRARPQPHLSNAKLQQLTAHDFDEELLMNRDGWWT